MTPPLAKRYDLAWRRTNLAALIVLAVLATAGLALNAWSAPRALGPTPHGLADRTATARELVNPNTATPASLDRLPGIGPALAGAIVATRDAGEPFKNPDDLQRVRGIGKMKAAAIAPFLTFDNE